MEKKSLTDLLAEVMAEVGYVQKEGQAPRAMGGYKFATAEAVLKKVNHALSSRGIAVGSTVELSHYEQTKIETDKGTRVRTDAVVRIGVDFVRHGETVNAQGLGSGSDWGDKAVMKANTAALKYLLANAFMISWGDDPEADSSVEEYIGATRPTETARHSIADHGPRDNGGPSLMSIYQQALNLAETTEELEEALETVRQHKDQLSKEELLVLRTTAKARKDELS